MSFWREFGMYWQYFVDWFFTLPLIGQIMVIVGIFAAIALTLIIIYYVIYGIGYLIYYILKGIYKIFEALYYALLGKEKPSKEAKESIEPVQKVYTYSERRSQVASEPTKSVQTVNPDVMYCTECGNRFTESMTHQLNVQGIAFCVHCGNGLKSTENQALKANLN